MSLTFYWKSTCSTCRDAKKVLDASGVVYTSIDYKKTALTADVVEKLVALAGGVAHVINTRHEIAKEKGWKTAPPDARTYAVAVAAEPNLIRRPILVEGKRITIGFDKAVYAKL